MSTSSSGADEVGVPDQAAGARTKAAPTGGEAPWGAEPGPGEHVAGEPTAGAVGPTGDERAQVAAERDEYLDALRRLQAEFDNYRKRTARQQGELLERATEGLLERLLPVLDAFDLALAHGEASSEGSSGADAAFVQIAALLRDLLAKDGLERIDAVGVAFDPAVHDAVAHLPADAETVVTGGEAAAEGAAAPPGATPSTVVAEVLRAGYRLQGRVLRPAMVTVRG